jgi:2-methylcitrate dehydratase PrpD
MTATQTVRSDATTAARTDVTLALAEKAANLRYDAISPAAKTVAGHCLLDWFGVTLGAWNEQLAQILAADIADEGGAAQATAVGRGTKVPVRQAALLNGAMSHALDFDDVNQAMGGHPTAPIAPVALALAEHGGLDGKRLVEAFVAGFETECRIGRFMGPSHYQKGWHNTATYGAIGAAAAASNLLRLDPATTAQAIGIAATQAAGLKSVFGTMCKPLHAGRAAATGLQAARLAQRGFTSNPAILEVEQGFAATQSTTADAAAALADPPGGYYLPNTLFKYHAACYLTHSSIEASSMLRQQHALSADAISRVELNVNDGHLKVCNIPTPRTGLEIKFSLRATNALALLGENTADDALFSDQTANRADVVSLRDRIEVKTKPVAPHTLSEVVVHLKDGRVVRQAHDVGIPMTDLARQGASLRAKFASLAEPVIGKARADKVADTCGQLGELGRVSELMDLVRDRAK